MAYETWERVNHVSQHDTGYLVRSHPVYSWAYLKTPYAYGGFHGREVVSSERGKTPWTASRLLKPSDPLYSFFRNQDWGNPFQLFKHSYYDNSRQFSGWWKQFYDYQYDGRVFAHTTGNASNGLSGWPILNPYEISLMIGAGTLAINRTAPTNPASEMMIAVAELLRDKPQIPLSGFKKDPGLASGAGEYLNYVFGIKPTISDVTDLRDSIMDSSEIVKQFERDSGKTVRRRYSFPTTRSVSVQNQGNAYALPNMPGAPWAVAVPKTLEIITTRRLWFSGAFTYYLNMGTSVHDRLARATQIANKLYGIRLTADILWALTPYSWLADWFGTMGAVLENLSAFQINGLVLRYGYTMAHTKVEQKYTLATSKTALGYDLVQSFATEWKQRIRATPYGFGLNPETFSDQQWAILAALGISKGFKRL